MKDIDHGNYLRHHGVPGMKWGVRKARRSEDSAKVKAIRKKKVRQMSNQDLRDANNRLQLESQYRDLSRKASKGNRAVKAFIGTAGTIAALTAATMTYKKFGKTTVKPMVDKTMNSIGNLIIKNGRIL